ncbi:TPA: hypothetical protein ACH3X2_012117 [Trebouxia sp. C0005]
MFPRNKQEYVHPDWPSCLLQPIPRPDRMQLLPHSGTQFPVMLPIVLFQWDFRCTLAVRPYGLLHFIICLLAFATLPPMPAILHLMARSVAPHTPQGRLLPCGLCCSAPFTLKLRTIFGSWLHLCCPYYCLPEASDLPTSWCQADHELVE